MPLGGYEGFYSEEVPPGGRKRPFLLLRGHPGGLPVPAPRRRCSSFLLLSYLSHSSGTYPKPCCTLSPASPASDGGITLQFCCERALSGALAFVYQEGSSSLLGHAADLFALVLLLLETSHFYGRVVNLASNIVMNLLIGFLFWREYWIVFMHRLLRSFLINSYS